MPRSTSDPLSCCMRDAASRPVGILAATLVVCLSATAWSAPLAAAADAREAQTATQAPARKPPTKPAARTAALSELTTRAAQAREAGDLPRAIDLYREALALDGAWTEGRWALGTAYYELDRFDEARDEFRRVLTAHADNGTAWAFKGLCEYRLKHYDVAFSDLLQARAHGISAGPAVADVARFHTALLASRTEQYEQALGILSEFALEGNDSASIIEALGIATLRIPVLPEELPGDKREMVMMAGRARYFMAARLASAAKNAFEALVSRYPEAPHVHYAHGVYLLAEEPAAAVDAFKRELKRYPHNVWATVQVAFAYIRNGEFEAAKPYAEQAVAQAPTEFVTRNALGQVRLETGDVDGAVSEFEAGVRLAPDSPQMHFALARAYRRANRTADAERAQAEFIRLDRLVRSQRTGEASVGGLSTDTPDPRRRP